MTIEIDLLPAAEAQLHREAAEAGVEPEQYLAELIKHQLTLAALEMLKNRPRPRSLDELKPRIPTPPGTSWLAQVMGKWPGEETDAEIERALEELS
jgi:hypothetical protein